MRILVLAVAAALVAPLAGGDLAASAQTVPLGAGQLPPPPLSRPKAKYYRTHPAEWDKLLKRLPRAHTLSRARRAAPAAPNTWTPLTHLAPASGLSNPLMLTDG